MTNQSYKLQSNLTKQQLLDAGFRSYYDSYTYRKYLYKNMILLSIDISKSDMEIDKITVTDEPNNSTYAPFYCYAYGGQNLVLEEVNKKYKTVMEDLVKKGVMKRCKKK